MKAKAKKKARVGQPFDDFLRQEGIQEEVHAVAIKRVIAWQLAEAMNSTEQIRLPALFPARLE